MSNEEERNITPADREPLDDEKAGQKRKKSMREKIEENDGAVGIRNISSIRSKIRRNAEWVRLKKEKKKEKRKRQDDRRKEREALGDAAPPKLVPKTLDSMREYDETTVQDQAESQEDEEVSYDIDNDEFNSYFTKSYEPKILITSCDNPHTRTIAFMKELARIIPNSEPKWRNNASIKKMVKEAVKRGFTDIVVINENNRSPNGLVLSHLPEGPTAHFRLSNVMCRFWIIGGLGDLAVIGYQSIREDNAITDGIK
jgi:ribosome production factor 1